MNDETTFEHGDILEPVGRFSHPIQLLVIKIGNDLFLQRLVGGEPDMFPLINNIAELYGITYTLNKIGSIK